MEAQDISSIVSAVANVVMAFGVVFAAKSLRTQKDIHIIDTHSRFQDIIRNLQEKMPFDINGGRITFTPEERRVVRLYWYAVVDEWITCKLKSKDSQINELWNSFAWGAKSAIEHIPLFASEFVSLKLDNPYLLGTHNQFFEEVQIFCITTVAPYGHTLPRGKKCVFLYGVPCSGKSTVMAGLPPTWGRLKIDDIVRSIIPNPTRDSFSICAEAVCLDIYREMIRPNGPDVTVVELGCLFPRKYSLHLIEMLKLIGVTPLMFLLKVQMFVAIDRAIDRNAKITSGKLDSILIDEPENISVFFEELDKNLPIGVVIELDSNEANSENQMRLRIESEVQHLQNS